ncbi:MAG: dCTP deaminase [Anaerolineae bacterium]
MGLKPDHWIRKMALEQGMIDPFVDQLVRDGVISYGLSSYGYDIRVADEFRIFTPTPFNSVVDPKHLDPRALLEFKGEKCIIPPNSFALARTVERLKMPPNALALCIGKSTYARVGLVLNVTPIEPAWEGYITLEMSNTTPLPAVIYANEGIGQLLFFEGDDLPEITYAMRKGKYQGQTGVTLPKVE